MKNTKHIKDYQRDLGSLIFTIKSNNKWKFTIRLIWRYDEEYDYIIVDKIDREKNILMHTYYSNSYSKSNLREARDFYDILLRSYRIRLPSARDVLSI